MSNPSVNDVREATARLEKELLSRLGLGSGASNEQIENAHEEIAQYLDKAPAALRAWSARQASSIDEAYALLRAPHEELAAAATTLIAAAPAPVAPASVAPAPAATPAPAQATTKAAHGQAAQPVIPAASIVTPSGGRHALDALDTDAEDWLDEADLAPAPAKRRKAAASAGAVATPARGISPVLRKAGMLAAGAVAVLAIGFGGYTLGAPQATPTPSADPQAAAFQEQIASLMQKLATTPDDIPTLIALGNLYYESQDFSTAAGWMKKVLVIDPEHVDSLLAYGAASFNLADYEAAEQSWRQVLEIDPANVEAYYDLGFLYFSDNPPNIELVKEMWGKVVELSPDSAVAKTVGSHLKSLDALASGAPTGSPAPGASPEPSTAPTADPSAAPSPQAS